jgi:dynein heavy chain 1
MKQVTKLDRDPSSGTALQEISFWLNLERALHRIQEKRESLDVSLTLDILKHGKRFHATVSFDTDTGANAFILSMFLFCVHASVTQYFVLKHLHENTCAHI